MKKSTNLKVTVMVPRSQTISLTDRLTISKHTIRNLDFNAKSFGNQTKPEKQRWKSNEQERMKRFKSRSALNTERHCLLRGDKTRVIGFDVMWNLKSDFNLNSSAWYWWLSFWINERWWRAAARVKPKGCRCGWQLSKKMNLSSLKPYDTNDFSGCGACSDIMKRLQR